MISLNTKAYVFCPFCGKLLKIKKEENKERQWCSHCNWTYYPHVASSVGAIIVNNGKVLMVKRRRDPYRGTWMFPAGFIDYGEHPEDTLIREVKEETGLRVREYEYCTLLQCPDDPRSPGHFGIFYRVTDYTGELINDEKENEDIQWFPINNLPSISWESHNRVAKILQNQNQ